jgi:hypothetical protein
MVDILRATTSLGSDFDVLYGPANSNIWVVPQIFQCTEDEISGAIYLLPSCVDRFLEAVKADSVASCSISYDGSSSSISQRACTLIHNKNFSTALGVGMFTLCAGLLLAAVAWCVVSAKRVRQPERMTTAAPSPKCPCCKYFGRKHIETKTAVVPLERGRSVLVSPPNVLSPSTHRVFFPGNYNTSASGDASGCISGDPTAAALNATSSTGEVVRRISHIDPEKVAANFAFSRGLLTLLQWNDDAGAHMTIMCQAQRTRHAIAAGGTLGAAVDVGAAVTEQWLYIVDGKNVHIVVQAIALGSITSCTQQSGAGNIIIKHKLVDGRADTLILMWRPPNTAPARDKLDKFYHLLMRHCPNLQPTNTSRPSPSSDSDAAVAALELTGEIEAVLQPLFEELGTRDELRHGACRAVVQSGSIGSTKGEIHVHLDQLINFLHEKNGSIQSPMIDITLVRFKQLLNAMRHCYGELLSKTDSTLQHGTYPRVVSCTPDVSPCQSRFSISEICAVLAVLLGGATPKCLIRIANAMCTLARPEAEVQSSDFNSMVLPLLRMIALHENLAANERDLENMAEVLGKAVNDSVGHGIGREADACITRVFETWYIAEQEAATTAAAATPQVASVGESKIPEETEAPEDTPAAETEAGSTPANTGPSAPTLRHRPHRPFASTLAHQAPRGSAEMLTSPVTAWLNARRRSPPMDSTVRIKSRPDRDVGG